MTSTSDEPLVSVVVIFLDAEQFIREAIESVFDQDYTNWELLLVDDGSQDASTQIAEGFARDQPDRIRYLEHEHHRNRGMSASRNLGARHARGSFLAFLDSDDAWLPQKLTEQLAIFEAEADAGMVCGATEHWYSWENGAARKEDVVMKAGGPVSGLVRPPALMTSLYPLGDKLSPSSSNIMLRREIFDRVGGFEEQFRGFYEDQVFLTKVYLETPVYLSDRCWDRYRQHEGSCTARVGRAGKYHALRHSFLRWLEAYCAETHVEDEQILKRVEAALWPYRHPVRGRLLIVYRGIKRRLRTRFRSQ